MTGAVNARRQRRRSDMADTAMGDAAAFEASPNQAVVALADQLVGSGELESFRHALGRVPGARFDSVVKLAPGRPDRFMLVSAKVGVPVGSRAQAELAVTSSGLRLSDVAGVGTRPGVAESVAALVAAHRDDPSIAPAFAVWFRLDDARSVHLLEVRDDVYDPGDGSLDGVVTGAGSALPGVRHIVVYLCSPAELRRAAEVNAEHPAVRDLRERRARLIYPPDDAGWAALLHVVPELRG